MKKSKLSAVALATCFTVVLPTVATLTSCGGGNIDIPKNPNIKIECNEIVVGKEMSIKYALDSNFGFDLEKSTITFGDSNTVVYLIECKVDRDNKTITVPSKYVTSNKVKIDIKAENSTSATVTKTQYNEALATLTQYTNTRAFKIGGTGTIKQYDASGKEISSMNTGLNIDADGYKDYLYQTVEGIEQPTMQYWGEKDEVVGAWQYAKTYETETVTKAPAPRSFASAFLSMILVDIFPEYDKLTYDNLYNAYCAEWTTTEGDKWDAALKFDSSHKLASIAYTYTEEDEIVHSKTSGTFLLVTDYSKPTITIPSESTIRSEMIYENPDEYNYVNAQLECAIHQNGLFGRFDIPLSKYTIFDKSKDLTMKLDQNVNVGGCEVRVSINDVEISPTLYTFDDSKYVLTIKKEAYSYLSKIEKLNIVLANPGLGGAAWQISPTKFIICQEIDIKQVTLTPNSQIFEDLNIPLDNYDSQTITNEDGKTKTASWLLDSEVQILTEQRYKFDVQTSSGTITKTVTLIPKSTAFVVEFTTEEWAKLTNGAEITINPDYINKTCPIVPQSDFLDYFEIKQMTPNPVVESGDRDIWVDVWVYQSLQHKAGTVSIKLKSDPSVVIAESDIPQQITTPYGFSLIIYGDDWARIPYDDELELHYKVKP